MGFTETGIISSMTIDKNNNITKKKTKGGDIDDDEVYIPKTDHNISNILDRIDMNIATTSKSTIEPLVHTEDGSSNKVVISKSKEIKESDLIVPSNVYKKPDSPQITIMNSRYSVNSSTPNKSTTTTTTSTCPNTKTSPKSPLLIPSDNTTLGNDNSDEYDNYNNNNPKKSIELIDLN